MRHLTRSILAAALALGASGAFAGVGCHAVTVTPANADSPPAQIALRQEQSEYNTLCRLAQTADTMLQECVSRAKGAELIPSAVGSPTKRGTIAWHLAECRAHDAENRAAIARLEAVQPVALSAR